MLPIFSLKKIQISSSFRLLCAIFICYWMKTLEIKKFTKSRFDNKLIIDQLKIKYICQPTFDWKQ